MLPQSKVQDQGGKTAVDVQVKRPPKADPTISAHRPDRMSFSRPRILGSPICATVNLRKEEICEETPAALFSFRYK